MKTLMIALMMMSMSFLAHAEKDVRRHFCRPNSTNISCQLELALVCGPGYVDGCLVAQTQTHSCVRVNEGPLCTEPVQILCVQGFRDACETGESNHHQCVPVKGPACKSGEAFDCPEGFTDDCDR